MTKNNNDVEKIKKEITSVLREHPEGLTRSDLAGIIGSHRQTVTKYVLVLEAQDIIHRRRIGSATLHYLKDIFNGRIEEKKVLRKIKKRLEEK